MADNVVRLQVPSRPVPGIVEPHKVLAATKQVEAYAAMRRRIISNQEIDECEDIAERFGVPYAMVRKLMLFHLYGTREE